MGAANGGRGAGGARRARPTAFSVAAPAVALTVTSIAAICGVPTPQRAQYNGVDERLRRGAFTACAPHDTAQQRRSRLRPHRVDNGATRSGGGDGRGSGVADTSFSYGMCTARSAPVHSSGARRGASVRQDRRRRRQRQSGRARPSERRQSSSSSTLSASASSRGWSRERIAGFAFSYRYRGRVPPPKLSLPSPPAPSLSLPSPSPSPSPLTESSCEHLTNDDREQCVETAHPCTETTSVTAAPSQPLFSPPPPPPPPPAQSASALREYNSQQHHVETAYPATQMTNMTGTASTLSFSSSPSPSILVTGASAPDVSPHSAAPFAPSAPSTPPAPPATFAPATSPPPTLQPCNVCASLNPSTARFCSSCGTPIAELTVVTLEDFVYDDYLDMREHEVGEHTARAERGFWMQILAVLGKVPLRELSGAHWDHYMRQMAERGCAPRTRALHQSAYTACLKYAHHIGAVERLHAFREIRGATKRRWHTQPLEPEEIQRLLDACNHVPMYRGMFALGVGVGLRPSELVRVHWQDIDLADATLRVRGTKTEQSAAIVPLTQFALDEMQLYHRRCQRPTSGLAFHCRGREIRSFKKALQAAAWRAGLMRDGRRVFPYILRHSFATLAACSSPPVPLPVAQAVMRHTSSKMLLETYARAGALMMRAGLENFSAGNRAAAPAARRSAAPEQREWPVRGADRRPTDRFRSDSSSPK